MKLLESARQVSERPILMSAPMVRATLDGRKTQTRRAVKLPKWAVQDWECFELEPETNAPIAICENTGCFANVECPYGDEPGDRLWVKETFGAEDVGCYSHKAITTPIYRATQPDTKVHKWKPSIFMPRWASRLKLEITNVRVERLQDISEEDAIAEGVDGDGQWFRNYSFPNNHDKSYIKDCTAQQSYQTLWESINGPGSWAKNPWVWVIQFKRIELANT